MGLRENLRSKTGDRIETTTFEEFCCKEEKQGNVSVFEGVVGWGEVSYTDYNM